jgi:hypothetical protein
MGGNEKGLISLSRTNQKNLTRTLPQIFQSCTFNRSVTSPDLEMPETNASTMCSAFLQNSRNYDRNVSCRHSVKSVYMRDSGTSRCRSTRKS